MKIFNFETVNIYIASDSATNLEPKSSLLLVYAYGNNNAEKVVHKKLYRALSYETHIILKESTGHDML